MAEPTIKYIDQQGLALYDALIKQYINEKDKVLYNTTAFWNEHPTIIAKKGCIYIYADYRRDAEGYNIPSVKIGDGTSYLIDMPFADNLIYEHIEDTVRHITECERQFWNNKVRCYIDENNSEHIIFTTN